MATKFKLPKKSLPWPIAWAAVVLIAKQEGLSLTAYRCPAGVWTIFYGETDGVFEGMQGTQADAEARLLASLTEFTHRVLAMCKRTPNPNQLGALVSLAYNIGLGSHKKPKAGGLLHSTILRQFNAGNDVAAARAFALYNTAKVNKVKQVLPGLVTRRAAEAALYLSPVEGSDAPPAPMPQAVAGESSLAKSPIAQGGAVTAGAGLTLLSAVSENAGTWAETASTLAPVAAQAQSTVQSVSGFLGLSTPVLLGIALVVAGVVILVHRYKQRAEGWA